MLIKRVHDVPLELEMDVLTKQRISNISFHRCILNELDFSQSILDNIDFRSAITNGIRMYNAIISNSKLIMVNGTNCDFRGANLCVHELEDCNFYIMCCMMLIQNGRMDLSHKNREQLCYMSKSEC